MTLEALVNQVISKYPDSEITGILSKNKDCGYYELCQSFLDISLNAPKFRTEDGKVAGSFQYEDIENAKNKTLDFLRSNNIEDTATFFEILENVYPLSGSSNDSRPKTAYIPENENRRFGYAGNFYDFTKISDDVYSKIIEDIVRTYKEI